MTAFRCTAKLLKAMKATPVAQPLPATNRLGEWTANLIRIGRLQLVIAVSEPTRLAVAIDAAPYATIPHRFREALFKALLDFGINADDAAGEAESIRPLQIAATASRSVLGAVNQAAWQAECGIHSGGVGSAAAVTRDLAVVIVMNPKHICFPVDRVREAFGLPKTDHAFRDALRAR